MSVYLKSVYRERKATEYLFNVLRVRLEEGPHTNISHKALPTWEAHCAFVRSQPYRAWYLIVKKAEQPGPAEDWLGVIYLSRAREVGIWVDPQHRKQGVGAQALALLRERWPGRILANVGPANVASKQFFERMGARMIQHTYEL